MKIKYICIAVRWFDRINGNTYHSVRVTKTKDGKIIAAPFQYGYGDHYKQTAPEIMDKAGWLPPKYTNRDSNNTLWQYERENDYPILWNVSDGLKRDCIANGLL